MTDEHTPHLHAVLRRIGTLADVADETACVFAGPLRGWLLAEAQNQSDSAQARDRDAAHRFAAGVRAKLAARRLARPVPVWRTPAVVAPVAQAIGLAAGHGCAPILGAAAGGGRALWDEPCEHWLEVPTDLPANRHLALKVAGVSMSPVLHPNDTILLRLDGEPRVDDIVVVRLGDDGFVVKQASEWTAQTVVLSSFNSDFAPITRPRRDVYPLGVVVASFHAG